MTKVSATLGKWAVPRGVGKGLLIPRMVKRERKARSHGLALKTLVLVSWGHWDSVTDGAAYTAEMCCLRVLEATGLFFGLYSAVLKRKTTDTEVKVQTMSQWGSG